MSILEQITIVDNDLELGVVQLFTMLSAFQNTWLFKYYHYD